MAGPLRNSDGNLKEIGSCVLAWQFLTALTPGPTEARGDDARKCRTWSGQQPLSSDFIPSEKTAWQSWSADAAQFYAGTCIELALTLWWTVSVRGGIKEWQDVASRRLHSAPLHGT
eukprot:3242382-Amphidinium_carterae.1